MTQRELRFLEITGVVLAALIPSLAHAQDPVDPAPASVHLVRIKGPVSVRHGEGGTWSQASMDVPLASGDHLATGPRGQADVALDAAHIFHLAQNAEFRITEVLPGKCRLALLKGSLSWQVTESSPVEVEVETPSVSVRPSHKGDYSIAVNRAGESEIVSRFGAVEVAAPSGSEWINTGQKMVARGPADNPEYKIGPAVPLWKRVAVIAMNYVQIAGVITDSLSSSGEAHGASKTTAGAKTNAGSPPAPPRERAPSSAPQHDSSRGKG